MSDLFYGGWWNGPHLAHYGIKGQKWGVRRFQNEDGTLTREGKERYLAKYNEAEKKADAKIEQAKKQLEDIEKNGWNAKSAFDPKFVRQLKRDGDLNDENLEAFTDLFRQDLKEAQSDKAAIRQARSLIEKNQNVTFDDILDESEKIDAKNKNGSVSLTNEAETIARDMDLQRKNDNSGQMTLKIPDYTKRVKNEILSTYTVSQMKSVVDELNAYTKTNEPHFYKTIKNKPLDEQFYYYLQLLNAMG